MHIDPIGTLLFPLIAMLTGLPLLGWAKPVPVDTRHLKHPKRDFAIVAAAGPISNLIIAAVAAVLLFAVPDRPPGDIAGRALTMPLEDIFQAFVVLNVILAVFNMIPVPPLDGGNVLMGVLPYAAARVVEQLRPYGFLILYALVLTRALDNLILPVAFYIIRMLLGRP